VDNNIRIIKLRLLITLVVLLAISFRSNCFAGFTNCICDETNNNKNNAIKTLASSSATIDPFSKNNSNKKSYTAINPDEEKRWGILFYSGATSTQQLGQLIKGKFNSAGETLYTGEISYTLKKDNLLRRIFQPLISTMQVAGNITYRNEHRDTSNIWEYDAYLIFRWQNFPWKNYLDTSLAASEGISYDSHIPQVENDGTTSDESQRLLNYLMFEAAFALPAHPDWQLAFRIQHRSNAYGVFGTGNAGSNNIGLGLRYSF